MLLSLSERKINLADYLRDTNVENYTIHLSKKSVKKPVTMYKNNIVSHPWSHEFKIIRYEDFLHFHFYLFNLEPTSDQKQLKKCSDSEPSYMIVQLPQQHVSEEIVKNENDLENGKATRKSFVSSFAYNTFEIPDKILQDPNQLKYNIDFFLNWNRYNLITLREKFKDESYDNTISKIIENLYPLTLEKLLDQFSKGKLQQFCFDSGLNKVPQLPISFYESPRKIFMAFAPYDKGSLDKYTIQYSNPKGGLNQYFPKNNTESNDKLFEIWNRNNWYKADNSKKGPESKIIGFAGMFGPDNNIELQPNPLQRENLAHLTNIPPDSGEILRNRNIRYDSYNSGAFGESSTYNYFNAKPFDDSDPSHKKDYQIVGANHITAQGKDNLDIITTRAVDVNTGLKVYVSIIAQRINKYKTSYLQQRFLIEYVNKEIDYENGGYHKKLPYKKIIAQDERVFFNPYQFIRNEGKPDEKKSDGYAVLEENLREKGEYPKNLIKFKYIGIDHEGKKFPFEMDMLFIPESTVKITTGPYTYRDINNSNEKQYKKGDPVPIYHQGLLNRDNKDGYKFEIKSFDASNKWASNALKEINLRKAENLDQHLFYINEEINIASYTKENKIFSKEKNDSDGNASLKTEGMFLYSVFENNTVPKFSKSMPVIPQLAYLNAYIPQLNGVEEKPQTHQLTYPKKTKNTEESKGLPVFLKTLDLSQQKLIKITKNGLGSIQDEILKQAKKIDKLSSNLLNSDSLVNLDLQIDSLSFGDNALISSTAIQEEINKIKVFDPSKIFGNAEILGFDLSKLFAQLLEEELPVTRTIQSKFEDIESDIEELLKNFNTQYGTTGQQIIDEWNLKIESVKRQLNKAKSDLKDRLNELSGTAELTFKNEAEKLVRLVNEEIKLISKQIVSDSRFDYINFYENNIYNKLINLNQNSPEAKIIKDIVNDFKRGTSSILGYVSQREVASAYEIKKAKERFISIFLNILIRELLKKINLIIEKPYSDEKINTNKKVSVILEIIVNKTLFDIYSDHGIRAISEIQDVFNQFDKNNYYPSTVRGYEDYKEQIKTLIPVIQRSIQQVLSNTREFNDQAISSIKDQIKLAENNLTSSAKAKVEEYLNYLKIDSLNQEFRKIYKEYAAAKVYVEDFLETFNHADNQRETIENELTEKLKEIESNLNKELEQVVRSYIQNIDEDTIRDEYTKLYDIIYNDPTIKLLSNPKQFAKHFEIVCKNELDKFYDSKRRSLLKEIEKLESDIKKYDFQIKNSIKLLNKALEDQFKNLTTDEIEQLKRIQKILQSNRSQKVEYKFSHSNLNSIDAGLAKLITNKNSRLNVDSKVEILFKNELPPAIEKKEAFVKTGLTNVGINIIDSIQVNFNRIYYQNGTNLPQDFKVEVRDIQFDGVFNFIAAFEKYLKEFGGDNLLLDFDSTGATIGYKYPLPKITFGYFNLFNLKLNVLFRLPFITGNPLKVILGINNPKDRFIVTVNGFPGTGYFFVELDPKKGVTKIAFLIEFGGHLSFNLGVARGSASLKAGIYYLKKYDKVDIGGYVICAGHFRVLGLFNASLVFNLRFKLVGDELVARGCVKASYRFSRWFKVSATIPMKHRTSFDHSNSKQNLKKENSINEKLYCQGKNPLNYAYSNLDQLSSLNKGDAIFLVIKYDSLDDADKYHHYYIEHPEHGYFDFEKQGDTFYDAQCNQFYARYSVVIEEYGKQKIILEENGEEIECCEFELVNDSIDEYRKDFFNSYFKIA